MITLNYGQINNPLSIATDLKEKYEMESSKGQTDRKSDIYISLSVNYIRLRLIKFRLIRLDRGHKILVSTADIALCQSLSPNVQKQNFRI